MAAMADYRRLRERVLKELQVAPAPHPARDKVRAMLASAGDVSSEWQARPLLSAYGIGEHNSEHLAQSAAVAEAVARSIGGAVALKVQSPDIPHKTEAGAVALNITADGVRAAYERVLANAEAYAPGATIEGVLVQQMIPPGREVILGVNRDERWGPLLMVGLGGTLVEAIGDVALSAVPLDRDAALALIGRLKGVAVFGAWRGMPEADTGALAELMVKLSQFAADHADDIAEIDLNPVIVHNKGDGVSVVDALIIKRRQPAERRTAAE
jgi:acyl-CoA synthetase (NDP forming)